MKILVYDVAASSGGALTILKNVYEYAKNSEFEWLFVLSVADLRETDNIKVLKFPEVKQSWRNRLNFDKTQALKLIEEYKPDTVLNLQNVALKCSCEQVLYLHQPLPFCKHKFRVWQGGGRYWIYQNVIGRMIKKGLKRADKIIVQSAWMKDAVQRCGVAVDKITVMPPNIILPRDALYTDSGENVFFYPASSTLYKNHEVIVKACEQLNKNGVTDYTVVFTLNGNESKRISKLYGVCKNKNLNINWIGTLDYAEVIGMYEKSVLLFPSYVETFGLPLKEARTVGAPILASDMPFSREILDGYDKVKYFGYKDHKLLSKLMSDCILKRK